MHEKNIILTGDRPTGPLHIGHYAGSLQQRLLLQQNHNQYVLLADLQALTDNGTNPYKIRDNIPEVMADYLAVGLDPSLTTFCLQSALPALTELTTLFMNLVSVARVERNPTVKNEIFQKGLKRSLPVGFFIYPISQAADIAAFQSTHIPVGDDQLPMLEQANELIHKMNQLLPKPILQHCKALLSQTPRLPGIDGSAKMSKTLNNTLPLSATDESIHKAVNAMYTDVNHLNVSDPGQVDGNIVFSYLDAFHPDKSKVSEMKAHYKRGGLGDKVCKNELEACLQELIAPIRERRAYFMRDKEMLMEVLKRGSEAARDVTQKTVDDIKRGIGLPVF